MDTTGSVTWDEVVVVAAWMATVLLVLWWWASRQRGLRSQERRRAAAICEAFVLERRNMISRLQAEGAARDDVRLVWLDCKRSEAERCRDAILRGEEPTDV